MRKLLLISNLLLLSLLFSCEGPQKNKSNQTIGSIERYDDEFDQVIPKNAVIQILSKGFDWSEGPLWISEGNYLLFSDIPPNRIYKWSDKDSISLFLEPSGYTGYTSREGEPGSNGLLLDQMGALVLCQHGDRRVAKMDAPLASPKPVFTTLADNYEGKRLNSPNDACYHSNGDLYFTDPPYGLERNVNDPARELDFQGVYKLSTDGSLLALISDLTRPNGIAFSPDEKILYVANSDPDHAVWMAYEVMPDGKLGEGKIFFNATDMVGKEKGLPDGLKVNSKGYIFATGPGGVLVFNPEGKHLGTIKTTQATANCAFNETQDELFITADMYLLRIDLKVDK
jgi:gluconolactonase